MSDNEAQEEVKKVKLTKKGKPDQRSIKSAANVSKARSKVKAFLKAGKQILHTSDDENDSSGDEVIDLVIRPKTAKDTRHDDETTEEPKPLRRVPLKQVLQRQENIDTDDYYKPDPKPRKQSGKGDEDKRYEKLLRELEGGRAEQMALLKQVEEMKKGITDAASKEHSNDVQIMRKKMLLRF
jgi:hypothetical protein